ncbi:hypothetical protein KCU90_g26, partial [Aureobasidium melanogenum]
MDGGKKGTGRRHWQRLRHMQHQCRSSSPLTFAGYVFEIAIRKQLRLFRFSIPRDEYLLYIERLDAY